MLTPQASRVLTYLRKNRSGLTALDALRWVGSFRLAARIHELRRAGAKIDTTWKKLTGGGRCALYVLRVGPWK